MNIYDEYNAKSVFVPFTKENITKIFTKEFIEVINYIYPDTKGDFSKNMAEYIVKIAERSHYQFPYRHYIKKKVIDTDSHSYNDTEHDTESPILQVILNEKFDRKFDSIIDYHFTQLFEIFHEFPMVNITDIKPDHKYKLLHFTLYYQDIVINVSLKLKLYYEWTYTVNDKTYDNQDINDIREFIYNNLSQTDKLQVTYNKKRIILDKLYKRFGLPLDIEHDRVYIKHNKKKYSIGDYKREFDTGASLIDNQYDKLREQVIFKLFTHDIHDRYTNIEFFQDGLWVKQPANATQGVNYAVNMPDGFYLLSKTLGFNSAYLIYDDYLNNLNEKVIPLYSATPKHFFCTECHGIKPLSELASQQFSGYYCRTCTPPAKKYKEKQKNKESH